MKSSSMINAFPLHDAVLHRMELHWEGKVCRLYLDAFLVPERDAIPCVLEFTGVARISAPHEEPWGPSSMVNNGQAVSKGEFRIEMQSGDIIEILADDFRFIPFIELP